MARVSSCCTAAWSPRRATWSSPRRWPTRSPSTFPTAAAAARAGPHGKDFCVQREVEDIDAVLRATGAHRVFGLSAGAIVMLEAALALPAIEKAVIFEPPLAVDGVVPNGWPDQWLPRLDREIADGNVAAALVTGMKGSQIGPAIFNFMPRWLLERLTRMMVTAEEKNAGPGDVTFTTLAPTLRYDVQLILDTKGAIGRYRDIQAEVLLLGGGKSRPAFLKRVLDALEKVLPRVRRVEFAELGHGASGNSTDPRNGRDARPGLVAQEMRRFFA